MTDNSKAILVAIAPFVIGMGIALGWGLVHARFEAAAYNRVTGSNVTAWDAFWLDLRVQDGPETAK